MYDKLNDVFLATASLAAGHTNADTNVLVALGITLALQLGTLYWMVAW